MFSITRRGLGHLRRNAVGYLALTIALGGTSYAATQLPQDSVGSRQIRAGAVRSSEIKDGELRLRDFRAGELPDPTSATAPAVRVEDDTQVELDPAHFALVSLDDEVFDTAKMHPGDGHDDRIRVPQTGTYVLSAEVEWEPNGNGYRKLQLVQLNKGGGTLGSSLVQPRDSTVQATIQQVTAIVHLREGTTVGLLAGHAADVPLEFVHSTLSAAFVGA